MMCTHFVIEISTPLSLRTVLKVRCFQMVTHFSYNGLHSLYSQGFHTIAEALSAMSNILLTDQMGDSSYAIETTNHPLPNSVSNKVSY